MTVAAASSNTSPTMITNVVTSEPPGLWIVRNVLRQADARNLLITNVR
jgi:hypothetical protein